MSEKRTTDARSHLQYLLWQWSRVPELVHQWHEAWDEAERLSFAMEWNHCEATLARVRELVTREGLCEEDQVDYRKLETLVQKHSQEIRALVYEDLPAAASALATAGAGMAEPQQREG